MTTPTPPAGVYSSGDRAAKSTGVISADIVRQHVYPELVRSFEDNFSVYGVRKIWKAMRRGRVGHRPGSHNQVDEACRDLGHMSWEIPCDDGLGENAEPHDLVNRDFSAAAPHRLCVADIVYV